MATLIYRNIIAWFRNLRKQYIANITAVLLIIVLFGLVDGSTRQLNLLNTVFSGEVTVKPKRYPALIQKEEFKTKIIAALNKEDTACISKYYKWDNNKKSFLIKKKLSKEDRYKISRLIEKSNYKHVPDNFEKQIASDMPNFSYVTKKIRTTARYTLKDGYSGRAELIGVNFKGAINLTSFLSLEEGRFPKNTREILMPSSLLDFSNIAVGDVVRINGSTSAGYFNRAKYKVCGVYRNPGIDFFNPEKFLISYKAMEQFYMPGGSDIQYCLFFKNSQLPENLASHIRKAAQDTNFQKIGSIAVQKISIFDVMNLSVQFNVFLVILIMLTIAVMITLIIFVNFNAALIIFRKRRAEYGTLISLGVANWKVSAVFYFEFLIQLLISTGLAVILAFFIANASKNYVISGSVESLFVLLTGTGKIDIYIKLSHILKALIITGIGITVAQIPICIRILKTNPIQLMKEHVS